MDRERYEILEVIGSGGMATVWRARDTVLDRFVAIKRPILGPDAPIATARFAREARAAATITHPNLVAIHDAGMDETGPYLVMELIDGPSLATANVADDRVARIGMEVASALAALHAAGVVHSDVKPGNILLTSDAAKLTDFGIARATADDTATITQPGVTFGTPAYAAPETVAHGDRSHAADVYSLAVTLHELLTGSRWNATVGSTLLMPLGEWGTVLAPALSADAADRPTAAAFAESLAMLDTHGSTTTPTTPMPVHAETTSDPHETPTIGDFRNYRRIAVAVLVGAVLLITVGAALASRNGDDVTGANTTGATPSVGAAVASTTTSTTTEPMTPPSTSATTAGSPPTTPLAPSSTSDLAAELIALIEAAPRAELKPNQANDIVKRIEEVVRVASQDPGETDEKLRETAEQIGKNLKDGAARSQAEELLIDLADSLGVPEATVTKPLDRDH